MYFQFTLFLCTQPTSPDRGWLIPFLPDGFAAYLILASSVPALLLTILLFMDQQITSVIVNRSEHKLKVNILQLVFLYGIKVEEK